MKKTILINIVVTVILFLVIESLFSIAWFQKNRPENNSIFASVTVIKSYFNAHSTHKNNAATTNNKYEKLSKLLDLREQGVKAYPFYLYDPQLHLDQSIYYLSNPSNSTILYCNENDFWTIYETDDIGFRNPSGQLGENIDFTFIGDSFTEGACVKNNDTFSGYFREKGHSVLNLGMGGSGPLLQLAILKEYGNAVQSKIIVWYVFTGNDMHNLREEKTTNLINYLNDENYSQKLLERRQEISNKLKAFLDGEIQSNIQRRNSNLKIPYHHGYGETLDIIEADNKEKYLLIKSAEEILKTTRKMGAKLFIVILNHYTYSYEIQDITSKAIKEFANRTNTDFIEITRDQLVRNRKQLYSNKGPHFSPYGYRHIAGQVLDAINDTN